VSTLHVPSRLDASELDPGEEAGSVAAAEEEGIGGRLASVTAAGPDGFRNNYQMP
jgi:hypothetical protein